MKFKGQGKINICGFEYKKKIADSRRGGGVRAPPPPPVSAPAYHHFQKYPDFTFTISLHPKH